MTYTLGMTKTHGFDELLEVEARFFFSETPVSGGGGRERGREEV
jgi:hypothetical protein